MLRTVMTLGVAVVLAALACGGITTTAAPQAPSPAVSTPTGTDGTNDPLVVTRDYVVLVSFDGIRHDYLDRTDTPTFDRLAETGVRAEALIPVFPSLTFPSHYSIATGMYPGRHGIVGNRFYDPLRDDEFDYRESTDTQGGSWWGGEPIWVTAERQGMVAASFFFPGTEAAIAGIRPTEWRPYDARVPNLDRVEQVLAWLRLPADRRPHLITVYFSIVDSAGHRFGPEAPQVQRAVRQADTLLDALLSGIERLPHGDRVYLVVVSDHGMASLDAERQIPLADILDLRGVRAVPLGPAMTLHLMGTGTEETERRALEIADTFNARVDASLARAFLRREAPSALHLASNRRFGDILIVPELGVSVTIRASDSVSAGMHGWDPQHPSMQGIFLARGPSIRPGQRIAAIEGIDVYAFLARVLDLVPGADSDATASALDELAGR